MGRQQGIASHVGAHLAVAQDEMRQDGEDGFTPRTLDAPDGEAAPADPDVMGMTCQIPATTAGGLVFQLKAEGEDERQHTFDKRSAIGKELKVGRFVLKIDGDGPVFAGLFGCYAHVSPLGHQVSSADETRWG
jgi:hypothetical protein